jgi:hypothetical protein
MLVNADFNRKRSLEYASRWALERNPLFTNYEGIGGDCTSFASQTLYAGSCRMNFTPVTGWYYITDQQRSAAWTGVEFLYNFLVSNEGVGPYGREVGADEALAGDLIQLSNASGDFYHTLIIIGTDENGFTVAAHSEDSYNRSLSTYNYSGLRYIHIEGVRYNVALPESCFEGLINGDSLSIL